MIHDKIDLASYNSRSFIETVENGINQCDENIRSIDGGPFEYIQNTNNYNTGYSGTDYFNIRSLRMNVDKEITIGTNNVNNTVNFSLPIQLANKDVRYFDEVGYYDENIKRHRFKTDYIPSITLFRPSDIAINIYELVDGYTQAISRYDINISDYNNKQNDVYLNPGRIYEFISTDKYIDVLVRTNSNKDDRIILAYNSFGDAPNEIYNYIKILGV